MTEYSKDKTPRELLPLFYKTYNLDIDAGGFDDSKVKIEVGKNFTFYFPNFDARRKALLKHDIHHILTGYTGHFKGETEISTWEVASGCKTYWAALAIDAQAFAIGFLFNLRGIFKAFARGRRTKNLYHELITNEQALDMRVDELQKLLGLDKEQSSKVHFGDVFVFLIYLFLGSLYSISSIVLLPVVAVYTLWVKWKTNEC